MSSLIAAMVLGACIPQFAPTAEMVRAQHGKPDSFKVDKCGGATDEYGKRIPPWKCLIWFYSTKGFIYFGLDARAGQTPYVVTGCALREPVITKHDGPIWTVSGCVKDSKETPCNSVGLGVDESDDFKLFPRPGPMGKMDTEEFVEWNRAQMKVCATKAEAQRAAKECAAPERKKQEVEPASGGESDPDAPKKL